MAQQTIAVVIPCYRVKSQILAVLQRVGAEVSCIYVVDDCCPEQTGDHVAANCHDPRVRIIRHTANQGVGGAMISGYRSALADGWDVIVKIDGDGQMHPELLPRIVAPILQRRADYTKGNRFFAVESLFKMPRTRIVGNAVLSFISKAASGYWTVMDPTNGYTAIHRSALAMLPLDKLDRRFFFESDMLFRLNTIRAVVQDVPMDAHYGDEQSNLSLGRSAVSFPFQHLLRLGKRLLYNYYIRDFNVCSVELLMGLLLLGAGTCFGLYHWIWHAYHGLTASSGTIMLAALPVILGFQLLLAAVNYDVMNAPREPLQLLFNSSADGQLD